MAPREARCMEEEKRLRVVIVDDLCPRSGVKFGRCWNATQRSGGGRSTAMASRRSSVVREISPARRPHGYQHAWDEWHRGDPRLPA